MRYRQNTKDDILYGPPVIEYIIFWNFSRVQQSVFFFVAYH